MSSELPFNYMTEKDAESILASIIFAYKVIYVEEMVKLINGRSVELLSEENLDNLCKAFSGKPIKELSWGLK